MKANFKKGNRYYWTHKSALAMDFLLGNGVLGRKLVSKFIGLYTTRPKNHKDYHRVAIEIIRTEKEVTALEKKYAAKRKRAFARFQKLLKAKTQCLPKP